MSKLLLVPVLFAAACGSSGSPAQGSPDAPAQATPDAPAQGSPDAPSGPSRPAGVALCYSATAEHDPSIVQFRTVFGAGDRSMRAAAITALDSATTALPNEEEIQLFDALAHLWRLAEPLTGEDGALAQLGDATAARDKLKAAKQLCPTDARIDAWLGPVLVQFGRTLSDQQMVADGLAALDEGIAAYPSFVLFSKLLVYADADRTNADFQNALDAVTANIDACTHTPTDPACTNTTVPHNLEGAMIFLADVYAKAQRETDARAALTGLPSSAGWSTWTFQAVQVERLHDLHAHVTAYGTATTSDDPVSAWKASNQCALCHTR